MLFFSDSIDLFIDWSMYEVVWQELGKIIPPYRSTLY